MQQKSNAIKPGAGENEKKRGIGIWKGEKEDDTETCEIRMSIMQLCNCKTTEIYRKGEEKTEKAERKKLSASLAILHLTSYTAYRPKMYAFQFPVMYADSKKLLKKVFFLLVPCLA
jgi:hypothetical protein